MEGTNKNFCTYINFLCFNRQSRVMFVIIWATEDVIKVSPMYKIRDAFLRAVPYFNGNSSELGAHFCSLAAGLRREPLRANNCQCQRSGRVLRLSIEINRLVESREKTGKARHRLMSSWSTLFRSSGFSWMKRSRVAPRDVTTCCYPLPSPLRPSPRRRRRRRAAPPLERGRANGCWLFFRIIRNFIVKSIVKSFSKTGRKLEFWIFWI